MTNPTGDALKASAAQVRHKKRGSTYDVIGVGKMQSEMWEERSDGTADRAGYPEPVDMREVVVYRSTDDGSLWVRPREEFEDGRFEPALSPVEQAPQPPAPETHASGAVEPTKAQIEAAIEAYERGSYLNDEQVLVSVTAIVRAALATTEGSADAD